MYAMSPYTNGDVGIYDLVLLPVVPISPFWFFLVLLVFTAIVSCFFPGKLLFSASLLMLAASPIFTKLDHEIFFQISYFFSFYILGILLSKKNLPAWVGVAGFAIWVFWVGGAITLEVPRFEYYSLYMLPASFSGLFAVIVFFQIFDGRIPLLTLIGKNALSIYVMHILATAGSRIILSSFGLNNSFVHLLIGCFAGVVLPLLAQYILQRWKVAEWFGLPRG